MEAKNLEPGQKRNARFDNSRLDGTVNTQVRRGEEVIYTQTLQHTPGKPINLTWNEGNETFVLTEVTATTRPAKTDSSVRDNRD